MAIFNKNIVLVNIFKILCLAGFLYQSFELLNDYLMGKTVISLDVVLLEEEPLPAVTVCTPNWLSMNKLSNSSEYYELYKKYNQSYQEYIEMMDNGQNEPASYENLTLLLNHIDTIYKKIKIKLEESHSEIYSKVKTYGINISDFKLIVNAYGVYKEHLTDIIGNSSNILGNPIESIIDNGIELFKCFTFNSFLKFEMDKIKIKLQRFQLIIGLRFYSISYLALMSRRTLISIHSPNSLPRYSDMRRTDGKIHSYYFSQVNTELLGEGYETNCYEYDLGYKFANYNMRSDCITTCFRNSFNDRSHFENCRFTQFPLRFELLDQEQNITMKYDSNNFINNSNGKYVPKLFGSFSEIEQGCNKKCRMDCQFRYYISEHKEAPFTSSPARLRALPLRINLFHNSLPDIIIRYLPQTQFISFVCNFGGLLGMWLGLSIISISEMSIEFFKIFHQRKKIYWRKFINSITFNNSNNTKIIVKRPRFQIVFESPG